MELPDIAHGAIAKVGLASGSQGGDVNAIHEHTARSRSVKRRQHVQQRAFTGTACSHDGQQFSGGHVERKVPKQLYRAMRSAVALRERVHLYQARPIFACSGVAHHMLMLDQGALMTDAASRFLAQPLNQRQSLALQALWHAAHGEWTAAHEAAQASDDADAAWVHALLHRQEGDAANARYWYRRAGKPVFRGDVIEEQTLMLMTLLQTSNH